MHTIFTLSQVGDLGNTAKKFAQIVKCFPYNTAAAKSTSTFHLDKIFHTTKQSQLKWNVIFTTSNHFHIQRLLTIEYVKYNLTTRCGDSLPLQIRKELRGKEDFWLLNGLASKFNSS